MVELPVPYELLVQQLKAAQELEDCLEAQPRSCAVDEKLTNLRDAQRRMLSALGAQAPLLVRDGHPRE
jgi:hypothetical protein